MFFLLGKIRFLGQCLDNGFYCKMLLSGSIHEKFQERKTYKRKTIKGKIPSKQPKLLPKLLPKGKMQNKNKFKQPANTAKRSKMGRRGGGTRLRVYLPPLLQLLAKVVSQFCFRLFSSLKLPLYAFYLGAVCARCIGLEHCCKLTNRGC